MLNDKFKDRVIEYFKKYYKKHKKAPPTRQVFKHFSKAKFYQTFPKGIAEACKIARIPVPEATIKRMEKALQASKKKRVAEATKQVSPWEDLKQSYKREEDERRLRKEKSQELAKQIRKLATDPNDAISGPVLDALEKVLPKILKRSYGINLGLWGIKNLNKVMQEKDLTFEQLQQIIEWTELSDEEQQTILDLPKKLPGVTLIVIAEYAKLTDQEKQGVRDVCGLALAKHVKVMELLASLHFQKRLEEDGVKSIKL